MRILGIDPGSRLTGFGCISVAGRQMEIVEHGTLKLASTSGRQEVSLEQRLLELFLALSAMIERLRPDVLAVERVFFAKNAVSALKLGQARGVILVCGALKGVPIVEYSPTEVKRAVTGSGSADKNQVARVLELLLGKQEFDTFDSSDALALSVCHAQGVVSGANRQVRPPEVQTALKKLRSGSRRSPRKGGLAAALGITAASIGPGRRVDFSKKS